MRLPILVLCAALSACAPFPELAGLEPDTGPPPRLLPLDDLLSQGLDNASDPGPALAARAARLKDRAAAIPSDAPGP
jgi:hypothetical protein